MQGETQSDVLGSQHVTGSIAGDGLVVDAGGAIYCEREDGTRQQYPSALKRTFHGVGVWSLVWYSECREKLCCRSPGV